eukprot:6787823-Prymnesium_polylepis.1
MCHAIYLIATPHSPRVSTDLCAAWVAGVLLPTHGRMIGERPDMEEAVADPVRAVARLARGRGATRGRKGVGRKF